MGTTQKENKTEQDHKGNKESSGQGGSSEYIACTLQPMHKASMYHIRTGMHVMCTRGCKTGIH